MRIFLEYAGASGVTLRELYSGDSRDSAVKASAGGAARQIVANTPAVKNIFFLSSIAIVINVTVVNFIQNGKQPFLTSKYRTKTPAASGNELTPVLANS